MSWADDEADSDIDDHHVVGASDPPAYTSSPLAKGGEVQRSPRPGGVGSRKPNFQPPYKVLVGNLGPNVSIDDIGHYFEDQGCRVEAIDMIRDKSSAEVEFGNTVSLQRALQQNDAKVWDDRALVVELIEPPPRQNESYGSGKGSYAQDSRQANGVDHRQDNRGGRNRGGGGGDYGYNNTRGGGGRGRGGRNDYNTGSYRNDDRQQQRSPRSTGATNRKPTQQPPFKVLVGNLGPRATRDDIGNFFTDQGCTVKDVIMTENNTSAELELENAVSVQRALEQNNAPAAWDGRPLRVDPFGEAPRQSNSYDRGAGGRGGYGQDSRGGNGQDYRQQDNRGGRNRGGGGGGDYYSSGGGGRGRNDYDRDNRSRNTRSDHRQGQTPRTSSPHSSTGSFHSGFGGAATGGGAGSSSVGATRPKLQLKPRTLPTSEIAAPAPAVSKSASIFGGGKPHDELEYEKLKKAQAPPPPPPKPETDKATPTPPPPKTEVRGPSKPEGPPKEVSEGSTHAPKKDSVGNTTAEKGRTSSQADNKGQGRDTRDNRYNRDTGRGQRGGSSSNGRSSGRGDSRGRGSYNNTPDNRHNNANASTSKSDAHAARESTADKNTREAHVEKDKSSVVAAKSAEASATRRTQEPKIKPKEVVVVKDSVIKNAFSALSMEDDDSD